MGLVSLLSLLSSPLPEVKYHRLSRAHPAATEVLDAADPPGGYHPWHDFSEQVLVHLKGTKDTSAYFSSPVAFPGDISSERGVHSLLYVYWTQPVSEMSLELARIGITRRPLAFGCSDCVADVIGCPDYVIIEDGPSPSCKAIVEAKFRDSLHPSWSPSQLCAGVALQAEVTNALRQMYSYIVVNLMYGTGSGYGIITNFESSWFCKVTEGTMRISEPVKAIDRKPGFYASLWYFLHLIYQEPCSFVVDPLLQLDEATSTTSLANKVTAACASGEISSDPILQRLHTISDDDIEFGACVDLAEHYMLYKANFRGDQVMLKCLDMSQKPRFLDVYMKEVHAYQLLEQVQGTCIPRLIDYGFFYGGMLFMLVLSDEGESIAAENEVTLSSDHENGLFSRSKAGAVAALESIHSLGLVHGDICLENIYYWTGEEDLEITWVNLEHAKAADEGSRKEEIDQLRQLLSSK